MTKQQTTEISQRDFENSTENVQQSEVVKIKFHRTNLQCLIDSDGTILVAIKPICEAIGVHTDKAILSIKQDTILKDVHTIRYGRDSLNKKNMMAYLPLDFIPGWLFQINDAKVSEAAKPKLISFKRECYKFLFNHFFGKYKTYETNLESKRELWTKREEAQAQVRHYQAIAKNITKQIRELDNAALTGQFQLAVKGGSHE